MALLLGSPAHNAPQCNMAARAGLRCARVEQHSQERWAARAGGAEARSFTFTMATAAPAALAPRDDGGPQASSSATAAGGLLECNLEGVRGVAPMWRGQTAARPWPEPTSINECAAYNTPAALDPRDEDGSEVSSSATAAGGLLECTKRGREEAAPAAAAEQMPRAKAARQPSRLKGSRDTARATAAATTGAKAKKRARADRTAAATAARAQARGSEGADAAADAADDGPGPPKPKRRKRRRG